MLAVTIADRPRRNLWWRSAGRRRGAGIM